MRLDWLTAQLAEQLHFAVRQQVPVSPTVNGLRGATLPGLLEYGCLRHALPGLLPPLPQPLLASDLGQALTEVRSDLGVRNTGRQKRPPRRLDRRAAEFFVIEPGGDVDETCEQFLTRFDWSAQRVGCGAALAHALQGAFCEMAANAAEHAALRHAFRLRPATRVVLLGTANDPALERYWSFRRRDRVPEQMARLGVEQVVGPNFSHFLDVPRPETLANRMRQLLCLEEMQRAGLSPVPHLSATQPADWRFWQDYLRRSPGVRLVAVEFETGNRAPAEGRKVIDRLAAIQEALGRPLHLLAIGGAQFTADMAGRLGAFTVIDSNPFIKALKRQAFVGDEGPPAWRPQPTASGQPVDDLLAANLAAYARWVEESPGCGRDSGFPWPVHQSDNGRAGPPRIASGGRAP